ncbi:MAG TPA: DUF2079 domain-containing protein, partial [Candidatus Baltobacteraceae bacterium]|nr:DUF2079 domain-containing protein [Candidatus Baltobacteraceae bacterium]
QTLLVLQVLAIAGGAVALCALALAFGASQRAASIVALAYVLSPSAQGIAYGNFLENVFVPLFAILAALAARKRSLPGTLLCAQVLLGLKEDEALFLLWFGAACALWWDRRIGFAVCGLAVVNGFAFAIYEHVTGGHPSIPAYSWRIDDPVSKISFFLALAAPFAFAPLALGRRMLLALPLGAELVFNRPWAYAITRIGAHWTAPLFALTAIGAAYAVAIRPRFATPMLILAILCALTINDTVLKIGRWPYVVHWPSYAHAVALRAYSRAVVVPRRDEGVYAVAAANPRVALADWRLSNTGSGFCPAYNRDGAAFFASLGLAPWPRDVRLCGGVPVPRPRI